MHSWIYKSSLTLDKTCHIYIVRVCKSSIQITDVSLLHCQGVHSHRPRSLICHFTCYIYMCKKFGPDHWHFTGTLSGCVFSLHKSLRFHLCVSISRTSKCSAQITDLSPLHYLDVHLARPRSLAHYICITVLSQDIYSQYHAIMWSWIAYNTSLFFVCLFASIFV